LSSGRWLNCCIGLANRGACDMSNESTTKNFDEDSAGYLARIDRAIEQSGPLQVWLTNRMEQSKGEDGRFAEKLMEALRLKYPAHRWLQDPTLSASLPLVLRASESTASLEFLEPWYRLLVHARRGIGAELRRFLYPFVLLVLTLTLFFFLATVVVPVFQEMFADFGLRIPRPTAALFALSHFAISAPWIVIALALFGFAALPWLRPLWSRVLDFLEFLPFVSYFRSGSRRGLLAMARWSGTLGELLAIDVPESQAILTAGIASDHQYLRMRSESMAINAQKKPEASWVSRDESSAFSAVAIQAMDMRREGKNVIPLFRELADSYTIRYCKRMNRSMGWMGPIIILFIGGLVLFIIFALFLPLTSLIVSLSA